METRARYEEDEARRYYRKEMKEELKLRDSELRQPLIDACNWLDPQPTNWRGACGGWRAAAT